MKVNSHNEWDKLKEVIVGTPKGTIGTLTWSHQNEPDQKSLEKALKLSKEACPKWFYDEVTEDLDNLAKTLESFNVKVLRPNVFNLEKFHSSPFWTSNSNNSYNVRDLNLVIGNNVIESPSYLPSRYYESSCLYDIWYDNYFEEGFKWIAERALTSEDEKHLELTGGRLEKLHKLSENEILFEAANTLRMGKDLLFLVSSS